MVFKDTLILAPIRGITNQNYRNNLHKYFGGFDSAVAPFITTRSDGKIQERLIDDVRPESNFVQTTPQLLSKDANQFLEASAKLVEAGHRKINLNLGCPYPMVATKGKGSGLLPEPEKLETLLTTILAKANFELTLKLRLGRNSAEEFDSIIPILNDLNIQDITIHPRIGTQMYQGDVDLDSLDRALLKMKVIPTYNGDINSLEDYQRLKKRYPQITKWMIGRGALITPALFSQIRNDSHTEIDIKKLKEMIVSIGKNHLNTPNGKSDFLHRMRELWEYLALSFPESKKVFKQFKKSKSVEHYWDSVDRLFNK